MNINPFFAKFSKLISHLTGKPIAFVFAVFIIIFWLTTGPLFAFSDTWQLVINTGTSIVTFLMVFLIQTTQNRDGEAVQLKLDELIRSHREARKSTLDLEELTEDQLDFIKTEYEQLAEKARIRLEVRRKKALSKTTLKSKVKGKKI